MTAFVSRRHRCALLSICLPLLISYHSQQMWNFIQHKISQYVIMFLTTELLYPKVVQKVQPEQYFQFQTWRLFKEWTPIRTNINKDRKVFFIQFLFRKRKLFIHLIFFSIDRKVIHLLSFYGYRQMYCDSNRYILATNWQNISSLGYLFKTLLIDKARYVANFWQEIS